jgi:aryl-alcohol dehydrogenase-like predicted oxidoreductase
MQCAKKIICKTHSFIVIQTAVCYVFNILIIIICFISYFQSKDEAEITTALNVALEAGYRHIDTAYAYENEKIIGNVLKQWFASGKVKREDLFITTKLPMHGVHPDRVEHFMKKSLENLQLDYVDLYLIHIPFGLKFDESTGGPKVNEKGQLQFEGKTDQAALWKVKEDTLGDLNFIPISFISSCLYKQANI